MSTPISSELPKYKLQNIAVTYNCGVTHLNLQELASLIPYGNVDPDSFAKFQIKLNDNPSATHLVYATGNNVCLGTKSVLQALTACRFLLAILLREGIYGHINNFRITNMVVNFPLNFHVDLHAFASHYSAVVYDQHYVAARYKKNISNSQRPKGKCISFLVYPAGEVVMAGCFKLRDVEAEISDFYNIIKNYRIEPMQSDSYAVDSIAMHPDVFTRELLMLMEENDSSELTTETNNDSTYTNELLIETTARNCLDECDITTKDTFFTSADFLAKVEPNILHYMEAYHHQISRKAIS